MLFRSQSGSLEFGAQQAEPAVSGQSQEESATENGTEQKPGDGVALPSGVDAAASDPEWQTGLTADVAPDMESNSESNEL